MYPASHIAHPSRYAVVVALCHLYQLAIQVESLRKVVQVIRYIGCIVERTFRVAVARSGRHCFVVRQGLFVLPVAEQAVGCIVMRLQVEQTLRELVQITLETLHRTLAIAVHILILGAHIQGAVLLHGRHVGLRGFLNIAEVFIHAVLAHIYILHCAEGVAGFVGAGIVGQQLVEHIQRLGVPVGVVVYQPHVQQCSLHKAVLRIACTEIIEVQQRHLVVVAHQIGIPYFKQRLGCQRRLVELFKYLVQIGQLVMILAHRSIRKGFLVGGIIGIRILGGNDAVVILDSLGILAVQIVAVAQTVVHIVYLVAVYALVCQAQKHLEIVCGIGHIVPFHAQITVCVKSLLVVRRRRGAAAHHKTVESLSCLLKFTQSVARLRQQIIGIGGVLGHCIDFGSLLEITRRGLHIACIEYLYAAVYHYPLVCLVHQRRTVLNLLYQRERILVVPCREIQRTEYLLHLALVPALGVLYQVVLKRTYRLVIRVGVQLIRQFGVIEQRILFDFGVIIHPRRLQEHAARLVLASQFYVHIAQHIQGILRHAVVAGGLLRKVELGRVVLVQHIMAVAYLVVAVLRGACHWLHLLASGGRGHIRHRGCLLLVAVTHGRGIIVQRILIFTAVEINLRHHLAYLVLLKHILLQQQGRSHLQQLVILAQIIIYPCYIRRDDFGKFVVGLQLLKIAQRQVILAFHILQMGIIIQRGIGILRAAVDVLREVLLGLAIVFIHKITIAHLEIILASVSVLHLAGRHLLVIFQRLGIVACRIMVIPQIEIGHIGVLVLRVQSQKFSQPEIGVAVAQFLGTHRPEETGLAGHLCVHGGSVGTQLVKQTLGRGVLFFLI